MFSNKPSNPFSGILSIPFYPNIPMRTSLFCMCFLWLGALCSAQELIGPDRILPGTLASFEIVPAQEASWHIVTPSLNAASHQVDTGLTTLYFASPERGRYAVIAGIVIDGKPELLVKTFINGEEEVEPIPLPPISSLGAWVKAQLPSLVKSKNRAAESRLVAECFEQIAQQIETENIKTLQNALAQLQITLTGTLALASPTAVTDWIPFLAALSQHIEKELGDKVNDLAAMKEILQRVANAMKFLELPESDSALNMPPQNLDTPRGTQNRIFRGIAR